MTWCLNQAVHEGSYIANNVIVDRAHKLSLEFGAVYANCINGAARRNVAPNPMS